MWPSRPLGREGDRPLLPRKDADPWTLVPTEPSGVETVVGTHFVEGLEVGSGGEETSLSILPETLPCFPGRSRCTWIEPGRAGHRLTWVLWLHWTGWLRQAWAAARPQPALKGPRARPPVPRLAGGPLLGQGPLAVEGMHPGGDGCSPWRGGRGSAGFQGTGQGPMSSPHAGPGGGVRSPVKAFLGWGPSSLSTTGPSCCLPGFETWLGCCFPTWSWDPPGLGALGLPGLWGPPASLALAVGSGPFPPSRAQHMAPRGSPSALWLVSVLGLQQAAPAARPLTGSGGAGWCFPPVSGLG